MTGGQIAALIFAILLLLPGGCFLIFGIGFATDQRAIPTSPMSCCRSRRRSWGSPGLLFWIAFRRRAPARPAAGADRMTGGQIAALIFAILLLLPGGCFLIIGVGMTFDRASVTDRKDLAVRWG